MCVSFDMQKSLIKCDIFAEKGRFFLIIFILLELSLLNVCGNNNEPFIFSMLIQIFAVFLAAETKASSSPPFTPLPPSSVDEMLQQECIKTDCH